MKLYQGIFAILVLGGGCDLSEGPEETGSYRAASDIVEAACRQTLTHPGTCIGEPGYGLPALGEDCYVESQDDTSGSCIRTVHCPGECFDLTDQFAGRGEASGVRDLNIGD